MVEGIIDELGQPMISILLTGLRGTVTSMAVVDTGFTGHVSVPVPVAVHLGLELIGLEAFELADGTHTEEFVFSGRVGLGSEEWEVPILLTRSELGLVGTALLAEKRLQIDFSQKTLTIT